MIAEVISPAAGPKITSDRSNIFTQIVKIERQHRLQQDQRKIKMGTMLRSHGGISAQ